MSAERDELVDEIAGHPIGSGYYSTSVGIDEAGEIADAVLAAGYRKQPQVTTVEELDALPCGSILLSHSEYPRYAGTVWRVSSGSMVEKVGREVEGVTPSRYFKDPLPATVLHVGGAE